MRTPLLSTKTALHLYDLLRTIRRFEETIIERYPAQQICCPVHLSIGQEAIAVGVCANLRKDDYLFSTHRNHGHLIAKGADLTGLWAELYGRRSGCCAGKGGSMHMAAPEQGVPGTSAIVAGGIPIAVGTALASKMQKQRRVSVVFFGDGAVDEGTFYESLNFAALHRLPVIFVCENNFYATNSPQKNRQANLNIHELARFFHIPGVCRDGNDLIEMYHTARTYISRSRRGAGPALIEARTYRHCTHVGPETDVEKGWRPKKEFQQWLKRCPVAQFDRYLLRRKLVSVAQLKAINTRVEQKIQEALEYALSSPQPVQEDLAKDVY